MAPRTQVAASAITAPFATVRSVGRRDTDNRLIHADNLRALSWLRGEFEGRFRCVYVDPPFNTGRTFAEYDDARTPLEWREFMKPRLQAILPLMADDGVLFFEIDDSELGPAITLCDEVFGRSARVSIITVVRSAATGHKASNRGPVNVSDFILVYEKTKGSWRPFAQKVLRRGYDRAYRSFLVNPGARHDAWRFESLATAAARDAGFATPLAARRALGAGTFERTSVAFALAHKDQVVRFAQPRYEAVSRAAQIAIDVSRRKRGRVLRLSRPGHADLLLFNGNRVLFLGKKVIETASGPQLVEPLTNVWDDVPFQGIAKEGGVVFPRNKKPERLIERVLSLSTSAGDWVLDPFVGSGTTAAVAEKMGRRWIGIDDGEVLKSLAIPRLTRVVSGEDLAGVTRGHGYAGGGGFAVFA